jgi:hypothetical protein
MRSCTSTESSVPRAAPARVRRFVRVRVASVAWAAVLGSAAALSLAVPAARATAADAPALPSATAAAAPAEPAAPPDVPAAASPPAAMAPGAPPSAEQTSLAAGVEEGVWLRREMTFWYTGFTAYYSCESLADKLKALLKAAGAREDARVAPRGCGFGPYEITRFSSAQLEFYTFVPASRAPPPPPAAPPAAPAKQLGRDAPKLKRKDPADPQPGTALWRTVELDGRKSRSIVDPGDCELVEQFVRQVLPFFTTRNVVNDLRCVPRQVSPWDVKLTFESLGPLPPPEKAKRPAR